MTAWMTLAGHNAKKTMRLLTVTLHPAIDRVLSTPNLLPSRVLPIEVVREYPAGKGVNAARVLRMLGEDVHTLTFRGGATGGQFARLLQVEGIPHTLVDCEASIRFTTLLLDRESRQELTLVEPRQKVSQAEADALLAAFERLLPEFNLLMLCGAGEGPALEGLYQRMIASANRVGVRCLLDTSGQSLVNALQAGPHLVKVNLEELSEIYPEPILHVCARVNALNAVIEKGAQLAAVSDGGNGMVLSDGAHAWHAFYQPEMVANTLGCGDAVLAGMAYALAQGMPAQEVLRWGTAAGVANTQSPGAGFFEPDTLQHMLGKVHIQPLK